MTPRAILSGLLLLLVAASPCPAGVYVTEASGIRWNDVGGIRWNDVGGIRWNDVGGILFTDASGIRWNDVGGIRWNDVGGILFDDAMTTGESSIDLELLSILSDLPDSSSVNVIVTFRAYPTAADLLSLQSLGVTGGTLYTRLPMVAVSATRQQIASMAALAAVRSVYATRTLSFFDAATRALVGLDEVEGDPELAPATGGFPTGAGVTIAVIDSGVDATHPDLPFGTKVVQNVRLTTSVPAGAGFLPPHPVEGIPNTDLVLGHGTFVASVAAGTGAASSGIHRGVAPGAAILSLSAGDLQILNVLEGFDYLLANATRFGVKVVNCSWGSSGFFDPDDPVNIATRRLYDAGITVLFAAGNHGPSPDTMNRYAVAPWVIGVGSTRRDGKLSGFSSRGIVEELLYHPTLTAPGEEIIAASPVGLNGVYGVSGAPAPGSVTVPPEQQPWYSVSSGTSFAAPHVAGVVALMLQLQPSLSPTSIKRILQSTAVPMLLNDRASAGAGRLDAWAALTQAVDAARPFGTHLPGWLDQRPWRVDHQVRDLGGGTVPGGSRSLVQVTPGASSLFWSASLAWGTLPGLADIDVRLQDRAGHEVARGESSSAVSLFGRAEGVALDGAIPGAMSMELYFKQGTGALDQPYSLREERSIASLTAYGDLDALQISDRETITAAVSRRLMIGRGSGFAPAASLTRGELARALALGAGAPQRVPSLQTFNDVSPSEPGYPYVESVAGGRARAHLIDPKAISTFGPDQSVERLDYAVAIIRAAGLEGAAMSRAGASLGLADEGLVPLPLRGYAALALERGFLRPIPSPTGNRFSPNGSLSRLEASRSLLLLLSGPAGALPTGGGSTGGTSPRLRAND